MTSVLITGSSGLVGSTCAEHFHALGYTVHGLDGGQRAQFFGTDGDTLPTQRRLRRELDRFNHYGGDIRDRAGMDYLVKLTRPTLVIHAAAQPSHDYAAGHPYEDWDINAGGTINLLEACRRHCPESPFVFLSTNKVYGDAPNEVLTEEHETRYDYVPPWYGIDEDMRIDASTHSLFGCSKLAADVLVQEYGRNFGMPTVCLRAGCLTGGAHAGAESHGFLAYLARCVKEGRPYRVYGHKGKQVRDNLHAVDVARACELFAASPRAGEVYNIGGGRANSCSVLEAITLFQRATGRRLAWEHAPARVGDHRCYITDTSKLRRDYPAWGVTRGVASIIEELSR